MFKKEIYKLWFIWFFAFIIIIIVIALLGIFLDKKIISNTLFGIGVISLLPLIYNFLQRKSSAVKEKQKGIRLESKENIIKYLGKTSQDLKFDSRRVKTIRSKMIALFSGLIFILCISSALLFALF